MVKVYISSVIDAPADRVWAAIRDFNALPKWHPAIKDSHVEGGLPSDRRLSILVDASIKAGAPSDYIHWLRGRPSNPPSGG